MAASSDLFCVPFGGAPAGASADSTDAIKTMLAGTARARAAKGTARARAAKAACDAAMSLRVLQNLQGQMDVGIRRSLKTPLGDGVGQVGVCIRVRWGARAEIQTTSGAKCCTARPEFSSTIVLRSSTGTQDTYDVRYRPATGGRTLAVRRARKTRTPYATGRWSNATTVRCACGCDADDAAAPGRTQRASRCAPQLRPAAGRTTTPCRALRRGHQMVISPGGDSGGRGGGGGGEC